MHSFTTQLRLLVGIVAVIVSIVAASTVNYARPAHAEPGDSSTHDEADGASPDRPTPGAATDVHRPTVGAEPTGGRTVEPTDLPMVTVERIETATPSGVPTSSPTVTPPIPTTTPVPETTTTIPTTTTAVTSTTTTVTTPATTASPTPTAGPIAQFADFLLRVTVGAVQYLVTLPASIAAATFALAQRIFHYIIDGDTVRITGYQNRGSDAFHRGLPSDVTVENVHRFGNTSQIEPATMVDVPPVPDAVSRPLLAAAGLALLTLFCAVAWRIRRDDPRWQQP